MMIATGMSLTEKDEIDLHRCIDKRKLSSDNNSRQSSLSVEHQSCSFDSLDVHANEWLTFWLFLVSSSYFLLKKNVSFFRGLKNISIARTDNDGLDCDSYWGISDLDKASYLHSLLILEDEDSEWLSDSKLDECSSENLSTPISYKCDSFTEISDTDTLSYWDSLLSLEGEENEWISDSKQEVKCVLDGFSSSSCNGSWGVEFSPCVSTISSEHDISVEHLLGITDIEEFSGEEPLFWPFEEEFNWNCEEPWSSFCTSPRRRLDLNSRSMTSRIKGCEQKCNEDLYGVNSETSRLRMWSKISAKIVVPLECEGEKVAWKHGEVLSNNKPLSLDTFLDEEYFCSNRDLSLGNEYFALDQELPIETLVGLKEFDGHEGLDWEFNDVL